MASSSPPAPAPAVPEPGPLWRAPVPTMPHQPGKAVVDVGGRTVAWFGALGHSPGPLCVCTSVNAAAQLVSAGIGIGIFPSRMIESYRAAGTIVPIDVTPPLAAGCVYVAYRAGSGQDRTEAAVSVIERVTRASRYFDA